MKKYWWIIVIVLVMVELYYTMPQFVWINNGYIGFKELQQKYENKTDDPVFSILLPTYNREAYLPRAITSVQGQTFTNFELIIVNDGSTDNTKEVVSKFQENDPRIVYIESDKNYGLSHSRSLALQAARGKYISILDDDDMFFPTLLATQYNYLEQHSETDIVIVKPYDLQDDGSVVKHDYPVLDTVMFLFDNCLVNVGAAIRKQFLQDSGVAYDESWHTADDYKFYASLFMKGARFHVIDQYLVAIRFHNTHSKQYYEEMKEHADAVKAMLKEKFSPSTNDVCSYVRDIENKKFSQFEKNDIMRAKFLFCGADYAGDYYILRSDKEDERILLRDHENYFCEVSSKKCGIVQEIETKDGFEKSCINIVWDDSMQDEKLCRVNLKQYWDEVF